MLRYFLKRGKIKKMCIEIEGWGFSVHFVLSFQENSHFTITFTLYIYVLTKILQNYAKFIQKLTPCFKNHMSNWDNFRQALGSPKSWNLMGYLCSKINLSKKYISSAEALYIKDLTFNYLRENPPNYLSLYHFSRHFNSSVFF